MSNLSQRREINEDEMDNNVTFLSVFLSFPLAAASGGSELPRLSVLFEEFSSSREKLSSIWTIPVPSRVLAIEERSGSNAR